MKFLKYFKISKFYWFLGLGLFIILAIFMGIYGSSFNLMFQYIMASLIATSWSVSLILMVFKRTRPIWWTGAIVSFWVGFMSVIFNMWSIAYIASLLCAVFIVIAYLDFVKNGPYKLKK